MADTSVASDQPPQQAEWNTQQYEEALAHLERLQTQLQAARLAIPSVVSPLVNSGPGTSKGQLIADVRDAALQATGDLKDLREAYLSEQMQGLLERCRQSRANDADLSRATEVASFGWAGKA